MASPSEDQFDRCSTSSSLEIVDALTEAQEDTPDRDLKDGSPAESVLSCPDLVVVDRSALADFQGEGLGDFQDAMTQSQYAQVIFEDIADSYQASSDLSCAYSLTPGLQQGHGDRVALYRLPFVQPHESVAYVWAGVGPGAEHTVTFPAAKLPRQEDYYQFQYLRGDNSVAGASIPFQLKVEPGHLAVQEELGGLQSKYSGLLHLSEKLSEELNSKAESFLVLEQENASLSEAALRSRQMEEDVQGLVASGLELKQALKATEETLARTEAVLEATTSRLGEAQAQVARLEARAREEGEAREERGREQTRQDQEQATRLLEEREKLVAMMEQEQAARSCLLEEKAQLLAQVEDGEAMLLAAGHSKDLAVEEIRAQVAQQDSLRRELAAAQEEGARAGADLLEARREAEVREGVIAGLGRQLELRERELAEREVRLDQGGAGRESEQVQGEVIEIHERCLEDADRRAEGLEKESRELAGRVAALEQEGQELRARLESGAQHYRRLVLAKERLEKQQGEGTGGQVQALEDQVRQLRDELGVARAAQELQLCNISRQMSQASSLGPSPGADSTFSSLNSSCATNMDSVRIAGALASTQACSAALASPPLAVTLRPSQHCSVTISEQQQEDTACRQEDMLARQEAIVVEQPSSPQQDVGAAQPSLFQPFSPQEPELPAPLLPEVTHCDVPELRPRQPAPYSNSSVVPQEQEQQQQEEQEHVQEQQEHLQEQVHCPWCDAAFPAGGLELEEHVEQHLAQVLDCPVCGKMFDTGHQEQFEEHVQEHFREQGTNLVDISIRGWDLGID